MDQRFFGIWVVPDQIDLVEDTRFPSSLHHLPYQCLLGVFSNKSSFNKFTDRPAYILLLLVSRIFLA